MTVYQYPHPRSIARVAVLDVDGLHGTDGQASQVAPVNHNAIHHIGDLMAACERAGIDQLWVHPRLATAIYPETAPGSAYATRAFVTDALACWDIPGEMAGWMHGWRRGGGPAISIVFPHLLKNAPWSEAPDGAALLAALWRYQCGLATPYWRSPGATGTRLMAALHTGPGAIELKADQAYPYIAITHKELDIADARPWSEEMRQYRYIHAYDKNAMYLAACSSLALGVGVAVEGRTFDKNEPGYWRATIRCNSIDLGPRYGLCDAEGWYPTPAVALAYELGAEVRIHESVSWPMHHRILEPWYKRIREARSYCQADPLALAAVKATYTAGIGWLDGHWHRDAERQDVLYRPDWRHMIISQAKCNLLRTVLAAFPVSPVIGIAVDCVYTLSDEPDPRAAAPLLAFGGGVGQWKVAHAAVPAAPVRAAMDEVSYERPARALRALQRAVREADHATV